MPAHINSDQSPQQIATTALQLMHMYLEDDRVLKCLPPVLAAVQAAGAKAAQICDEKHHILAVGQETAPTDEARHGLRYGAACAEMLAVDIREVFEIENQEPRTENTELRRAQTQAVMLALKLQEIEDLGQRMLDESDIIDAEWIVQAASAWRSAKLDQRLLDLIEAVTTFVHQSPTVMHNPPQLIASLQPVLVAARALQLAHG